MSNLAFPDLIARMIQQESGGNPNAVSPAGAMGLMQVMPGTAADPGFGVAPLSDPFDPAANRAFGESYISAMLSRYGGDQSRALVAYNWGPGKADAWDGNVASLPEETQGYLAAILGSPSAPASAAAPPARPADFPAILPPALGMGAAPVVSNQGRPAPPPSAQQLGFAQLIADVEREQIAQQRRSIAGGLLPALQNM